MAATSSSPSDLSGHPLIADRYEGLEDEDLDECYSDLDDLIVEFMAHHRDFACIQRLTNAVRNGELDPAVAVDLIHAVTGPLSA